MIGTDVGLVVGSRSVAVAREGGQGGERPLWPCFLFGLHSQIHSITICSNVTTGASDLLRMVTIDLGHHAFFAIRCFCFGAGLEHAHACDGL